MIYTAHFENYFFSHHSAAFKIKSKDTRQTSFIWRFGKRKKIDFSSHEFAISYYFWVA